MCSSQKVAKSCLGRRYDNRTIAGHRRRWTNAAAVEEWSERRFAPHKKYAEVVPHADFEQFLKLPKPDRVDRIALNAWPGLFQRRDQSVISALAHQGDSA